MNETTLHIDGSLCDELLAHARSVFPDECCGILIGSREGLRSIVDRVARATNIAAGDRARSFQIDWTTLFETVRRTRRENTDIVGFYHSHPDGTSKPSRRDTNAAWPDHSYVIIPITDSGCGGPTSWRMTAEAGVLRPERISTPAVWRPRDKSWCPGNAD